MEIDNPGKLRSDTAFLGTMLALALALHTIERWLPIFPMPGMKIGLANIISLIVLVGCGWKDAFLITVLRVVGGSLLDGRFLAAGFIIALSGGVVSILGMQTGRAIALRFARPPLSVVGISCIGAAFHNIGQITAAAFILHDEAVIRFLPFLLFFAFPSGILTGIIGKRVLVSFRQSKFFSEGALKLVGMKKYPADWFVAAAILLSGAVLLFWPLLSAEAAKRATVKLNGTVVRVLDLEKEEIVVVEAPHAIMTLEVKDHRVRVSESNCSNQTCVATGWIAKPGQMIACIPNGVIVEILHQAEADGVDAIAH